MTNSKHSSIRARLIPNQDNIYQRVATISTRPFRLAFIINERTTIEQLVTILQYNCLVWGGYYNLMIPTDGKNIANHWYKSLVNHDPDYIMICGDLDSSWVQKLHEEIQPFTIWSWEDEILSNHLSQEGRIGSISLEHILVHLHSSNKPISNSNICIPQFDVNSSFYLHSVATFGHLPTSYQDYIAKQLKGDQRDLISDTLENYLENQRVIATKLTPIKLTTVGLDTDAEHGGALGFNIVLSGRNLIQDFSLFWNYRMQSPFPRKEPLFIPVSSLSSNQGIDDLAKYCKAYVTSTNFIVLASASVGKKRLAAIRDKLKVHLGDSKIKLIDIQFSNFVTGKFRTHEKTGSEKITIKKGYFSAKSLGPNLEKFETYAGNSKWVVDIQFETEGQRPFRYIPPKFPSLGRILSGSPEPLLVSINLGYQVRFANRHLSYKVGARQQPISGYIPQEFEIFGSLVEDKGFAHVASEKSKYVQGIIGLLGDLDETTLFQDIKLLTLLREMAKGIVFSPTDIKTCLKPGKDQSSTNTLIADMSLKSVFLRGFKIHCPACDLTRWYPMDSVTEKMPCAGCLTLFQLPIDAHFYYKLNELLTRGVQQGALPVLLTLIFLKRLSTKGFMYLPGLIIKKEKELDIDIIASCDGQLVLVECKDLHQNSEGQVGAEIIGQLTEVAEAAQELNAPIVFLSTLLSAVPNTLQKQIDSLNKRLKGMPVVHLLTFQDLERGYKLITDEFDSTKQRIMKLSDFLPSRATPGSGWIKEAGVRSISF